MNLEILGDLMLNSCPASAQARLILCLFIPLAESYGITIAISATERSKVLVLETL